MPLQAFRRLITLFTPPLLSSSLLALAFPDFNLSVLAWIGLTPMLLALLCRKPTGAFVSAYLFGMLYFSFVFTWMFTVPKYVVIHHALLALYLGFYIGLFGLAYNLIARAFGAMVALLSVPAIWVVGEFARANMGFLSHPGALLAHSQYQNILLIQMASITGVYGISFIVVLVNAVLASVSLIWLKYGKRAYVQVPAGSPKQTAMVLGAAGISALLIVLIYGCIAMQEPLKGPGYKIALVQANIEQNRKWDPHYARWIMETYTEMTLEAATRDPDLIIWPEAATPGAITQKQYLLKKVIGIARKADRYLLIGSTSHNKYEETVANGELNFSNSAFLIPPGRTAPRLQRYDKIHLLPFGEYLPQKSAIPWELVRVPEMGNFIAGKKYVVFEHPAFKFSTIICWEGIFPGLARQFVKNGAQFLITITNEGWFGNSAGPYHFLIMSLFRAVENHTYVVRCANTGVSCVIDPFGRILNRIRDDTGEDIFVKGLLTETIVPMNGGTVYTRVGDVFAGSCGVFLFVLLVAGALRARRRPRT